jgi:glycosyltransferase involved in cell wall biosynthesis
MVMPAADHPTVLHYVGYDTDVGGIVSVVRALAGAGRFTCVLGMNRGSVQARTPPLEVLELPRISGEKISPATAVRAFVVARAVRKWLRDDQSRIFHGHSRAGLLVARWLASWGERRVAATVHVFGRQRWFYRSAAARLGGRLCWLGPAMKHYYGLPVGGWEGCLPDCISQSTVQPMRSPEIQSPVTFGCVGGVVPVKRWELVIEALAQVPAATPMRVVHAGAEEVSAAGRAYANRLRRRVEELALASRFEWRGPVEEMAEFYAGVDCLIVPSSCEASSVAALEAIAAGVPVLASAASGTRDLVDRCSGGWLFEPDTAETLGGRMTALARGPELANWRRNEAGLEAYTATVAAAAHLALYRTVLTTAPSAPPPGDRGVSPACNVP